MTQELVKELFEYRDGNLYWRMAGRGRILGQIAGSGNYGYRLVSINYKNYVEHRLIWLYHYGNFPANQIDHINGVKYDNRIENLSQATHSQNQANRHKWQGTTSQFKGVSWYKRDKKWAAQIKIDGKSKNLGCFDEEFAAAQAYNEAAIKHFGEFALINKL